MRSVDSWFSEYSESHRNPTNEALHFVCVPAIVLSMIGLLWSLPVPAALASLSPAVNWASLAALAIVCYYALLSPRLALGMLPLLVLGLAVIALLARLPAPLWATSAAIFVIAWIGQFVGHAAEGRRPSFFKDAQFLLIGPLWVLSFAYRRLGLRY
jgi:uncharacterized membrane protein YGL010W